MFTKRHPSAGAVPGTLLIPEDAPPPKIHVLQYGPNSVQEKQLDDIGRINAYLDDETVTWIDVQGLGDERTLLAIGERFGIHPLALEDVVNIPQRPKAEPYDNQMLIVCRVVEMDQPMMVHYEQISLILGPNYVITFQEHRSHILDPVRRRIHSPTTRIRHTGADYLAYAILDAVVDTYYPVLECIGEKLERLEEVVVERPEPRLLKQMNTIRNRLARLRRAVWPKREMIRSLMHDDNPLIGEDVHMFLRDTYDHVIQVSDAVDMCRDMLTGLMNTYISSVGQRTNEVMKVLTIMSSIFVPLTFLAGIYGMNFENMPELRMKWAYPMVWLTMAGTVAVMLLFFRSRGWIGGSKSERSVATKERTPAIARHAKKRHREAKAIPVTASAVSGNHKQPVASGV